MKFLTVASLLLAADVALAARLTEARRARAAARALNTPSTTRKGSSNLRLPADSNNPSNNSNVDYSANWAGAVLTGTGFKSVTGTFTVPTPSAPSGGSSRTEYAASAWVGIDGDTGTNTILQTGVDFYYEGGEVGFDAWYEWYPDYAYNFDGIDISAGDDITVTVTATSKTAGTALVENKSTGQTVSHSFSSESRALSEIYAEWIVEDFESGGNLVPFANFGTVVFTGASAVGSSGTIGPASAGLIDIEQNSKVLTSASVSSSSVTVKYV